MKTTLTTLLFIVLLLVGCFISYSSGARKYRAEITVLQGQVDIYKTESEKLAKILRSIRETAATAVVTEKAQ
jgi:cytochrome b561